MPRISIDHRLFNIVSYHCVCLKLLLLSHLLREYVSVRHKSCKPKPIEWFVVGFTCCIVHLAHNTFGMGNRWWSSDDRVILCAEDGYIQRFWSISLTDVIFWRICRTCNHFYDHRIFNVVGGSRLIDSISKINWMSAKWSLHYRKSAEVTGIVGYEALRTWTIFNSTVSLGKRIGNIRLHYYTRTQTMNRNDQ